MENIEIAQQVERHAQHQKAMLSQLIADVAAAKAALSSISTDLSSLKQEASRQASASTNGSGFGIGQSLERAGYNLSVSVTSFGKQLKEAALWGALVFGTSVSVILTLMYIILREI